MHFRFLSAIKIFENASFYIYLFARDLDFTKFQFENFYYFGYKNVEAGLGCLHEIVNFSNITYP